MTACNVMHSLHPSSQYYIVTSLHAPALTNGWQRLKKLAKNALQLADYTLSHFMSHQYIEVPMNHERKISYFFFCVLAGLTQLP
jgi:hypothetical protein